MMTMFCFTSSNAHRKENEISIPEVTNCIRIYSELHVQLFFKGTPVPLPQSFWRGADVFFSRKSMLENSLAYLQYGSGKVKDENRAYLCLRSIVFYFDVPFQLSKWR